jgi:hypothetical protein
MHRVPSNPGLGKMLRLVVICVAVCVFLMLGTAHLSLVRAQTPESDWEKAAGGKMSFDVVSVKQNRTGADLPYHVNMAFDPGETESAAQAPLPMRMVIATGVVCREEPNATARTVHEYNLGDLVAVAKESRPGGTIWYLDQWQLSGESPSCWIYAPLTTAWEQSNQEAALLAVVDHLLLHPKEGQFEDYAAVENLLTRYSSVVASSGLLQFRELALINQAISRDDAYGRFLDKEPLKKSWILSHGDLLVYFDPDDRWYIRPESYWSLYEKYKQASWAEDLAWAAAQMEIPSDECYASCVLDKIDRTYSQYWTRYPKGSKVSEALAEATPLAKYAASLACSDPDSDFSVPRPVLEQFRNSLVDVTAPGKRSLLKYVDDIEQKCYPDQH